MDIATIYAKTRLRTLLNMGFFYPSSEGFLMICIQNMCGTPIQVRLIPILVGVIYDGIICSMAPFEG